MRQDAGVAWRDFLVFAVGVLLGAFGIMTALQWGSDALEVENQSPVSGIRETGIEPHRATRELEGPAFAGASLDADGDPPKGSRSPVVAIGPLLDADAEVSISTSNDGEKIVRVGEPLDADEPR